MATAEKTPPVLARIRFNAYEVSVLDVNPPAYIVPGKIAKLLNAYGFEGHIKSEPNPSYPRETRAVLLVRFKGDDIRNEGIPVQDDQEILIHGHKYFTIESDDWS